MNNALCEEHIGSYLVLRFIKLLCMYGNGVESGVKAVLSSIVVGQLSVKSLI